jgi:hypothetical protein
MERDLVFEKRKERKATEIGVFFAEKVGVFVAMWCELPVFLIREIVIHYRRL